MEVIASTAFGLDIDAQKSTAHPFVVHASRIMGSQEYMSGWAQFKMLLVYIIISMSSTI